MTLYRLAPMAGVTDWPFRLLCARQGCRRAYTEMVSAKGYLWASEVPQATKQLLERHPEEKELILQLFGKEPDLLARAAKILGDTGVYDGVDLNMGCPAHKIAGAGEGSGLLQTPELASEIMRQVVQASPVPVSVKMRLGWDEDHINILEMVKRAEDAGVSEITIHGRTRMQQYGGEANWDLICRAAESVKIPVIGNGDLLTAESAYRKLHGTKLQGVMLGRGVMGNPWIFRQLSDLEAGRPVFQPDLDERLRMIREHYDLLLSWKPEHVAVKEMRKHVSWYLHGLRGAARMRLEINRLKTPDEVFQALNAFREDDERFHEEG